MSNVATSVRITGDAQTTLSKLSLQLGQPKAQVNQRALREWEERVFWAEVQEAFARAAGARAPAKNPIHIPLTPGETGLETPSTALVDHGRFVDRSRLRAAVAGRLTPSAMLLLDRHLERVFGLSR